MLGFTRAGQGPTGWRRGELKVRRTTQRSRFVNGDLTEATAFLIDTGVQGKGVVLAPAQNAMYMHVDELAAIASGDLVEAACENANSLMKWVVGKRVDRGRRPRHGPACS